MIKPVLLQDRTLTLKAIDKRLRNKKKWEDEQTAPHTDLVYLKEQLEQL